MVLMEQFAANELDRKPGGGDEVRKLVQDVYPEVRQGATIRHTLQVVTGRKAGGAASRGETFHI